MNSNIAIVAALLAGVTSAHAGITLWTFNGANSSPVSSVNASGSNGTFDNTKLSSAPVLTLTSGHGSHGGNTADAVGSISGGTYLIQATGTDDMATREAIDNSSFVLTLVPSGASLGAVQVSYQAKVATGSTVVTWQYAVATSLGAASFANFPTTFSHNVTTTLSSFSTGVVPSPTFTSGQNLYIRADFSGAEGTASLASITFDNIAVPEPTNIALGLFGVGAMGITAARRYLRKKPTSS